jgi:hypothetical protein
MKKFTPCLILILLIASCSDDHSLIQSDQPAPSVILKERRDQLKTAFGTALAGAMADSPTLRKLIKEEALKMFNNDYDVLYHLIKDTKLDNDHTVRQLLLPYFENEKQLQEIERDLPLLTIFVPVLPENTFSASLWDTDNQVPSVGVTSYKTNDVNVIDHTGAVLVIKAHEIPGFPVVVIKENERVVSAQSNGRAHARGKSFRTNDNAEFVFLADCFDGSVKTGTNARFVFSEDQKLVDAYNIYNGIDGWHRDYIYYNITPSQDRGQFSYDYQEHVTSFNMVGDPTSAFSKISDQTGDPQLQASKSPNSGWTGGFYEFKVRVLLNAKNGIGEEFITYFSAMPDELFTLTYTKYWLIGYIPTVAGLRQKTLRLPLFPWDLNNYASTIKIEVEEVDVTETVVTTESRTVKFATNFEISGTPTGGLLQKIGMKFGASPENTTTQSTQRTYTVGNDLLGAVIVNFADNVILGPAGIDPRRGTWEVRDYSTGWYSLGVEPVRVQ